MRILLSAIVVLILGSIGCGEDAGSSGTGQIRFLCNPNSTLDCEIVSPENLRQTVPIDEERIFGSIPHGSTIITVRYWDQFQGGPPVERFDSVTVEVCAGQTTFLAFSGLRFDPIPCPVS